MIRSAFIGTVLSAAFATVAFAGSHSTPSSNTATIVQVGKTNGAAIGQFGTGHTINTATTAQFGKDNWAVTTQKGGKINNAGIGQINPGFKGGTNFGSVYQSQLP